MKLGRWSPARACAIGALLLAAGLAAAIPPAEGTPDPWGLDDRFASYEVLALDPVTTKAKLAANAMTLTLMGRTFELDVAPVPWQAHLDAASVDGGVVRVQPSTWETVAYHGAARGVDGSRALVVVTSSGVAGHVQTADERVLFEPVSLLDATAPPGVSVAYRAGDVLEAEGLGHSTLPDLTRDPRAPEAPEAPLVPLSHTPPGRVMTLWADMEMTSDANWLNRVSIAWNTLNSQYATNLGWSFTLKNNLIYYCDTSACQTSWGMTSSVDATLLTEWPNAIRTWSTISGFEIAALFTGKNLQTSGGTGINGAAWQPGRYSVTKATTSLSQAQVDSILAHEVGHNYAGDHSGSPSCPSPGSGTGTYGRARCYDHWHSNIVFVCDVGVGGVCVSGHFEDQGSWHKHYTLMWSGQAGNRDFAPSSQNYQYMRECAGHHWTGGTYSPGGTSGFGSWCTG